MPREQDRSQVSGRGEGLGLGEAVICVSICQPSDPSSAACAVAAHCTHDVYIPIPTSNHRV